MMPMWLYWYLGIGVLSLLIIYGSHKLSETKDSADFQKLLDAVDHRREHLGYRILVDYLVPMLAAIAIVLVWPIPVCMKIRDLFKTKPAEPLEEPKEFAVKAENLLEKLSVEDIEQRERVHDPLQAVPSKPFGHLHSAWSDFLTGKEAEDAIWSFSAQWDRFGRQELRAGYVFVRHKTIGKHFLTVWKDVDEHTTNEVANWHTAFQQKHKN